MPNNEKISYQILRSRSLKPSQIRDIVHLTRHSILADYRHLSSEQVDGYLAVYEKGLKRPNSVVGDLTRDNQAFARSASLLAIQDGELIAHVSAADNSSTTRPGPVGWAEIKAKLYVDATVQGEKLMEHRYVRLGHAAMTDQLHEIIEEDPTTLNPIDVMIALAINGKDDRQPVKAYPWDAEKAWRAVNDTLGMEVQDGNEKDFQPFGPTGPSVHQETVMLGRPQLYANILEKPGGEEAVKAALGQ